MMQYVQHLSGQGKRWEVVCEYENHWNVRRGQDNQPFNGYNLPKSEYRLCEPPEEQWKDVTARLVEHIDTTFRSRWDDPHEWGCALIMTDGNSPYRLRRVQFLSQHEHVWAFVVEKRMP